MTDEVYENAAFFKDLKQGECCSLSPNVPLKYWNMKVPPSNIVTAEDGWPAFNVIALEDGRPRTFQPMNVVYRQTLPKDNG